MSVTGIVAALTAEARTLGTARRLGAESPPIYTLDDGTLLSISGMGPDAAAGAAKALGERGIHGLLSFGLAGALDPTLPAGALLLPEAVTDGGSTVLPTYAPWRERLAAQWGRHADARDAMAGTLLGVTHPLTTVETKRQARAASGACAVDMESLAIAGVAARLELKFLVVRVVVDTAADVLPSSVMNATGAYGEVRLSRLLAGLLRHPAQLPALMALSRRYGAALRTLKSVAQLGLGTA